MEGVLVEAISPVASSIATTSVNVPPVSIAIRKPMLMSIMRILYPHTIYWTQSTSRRKRFRYRRSSRTCGCPSAAGSLERPNFDNPAQIMTAMVARYGVISRKYCGS